MKAKIFEVKQNEKYTEIYEIIGLDEAFYNNEDPCSSFTGIGSLVNVTGTFINSKYDKLMMLCSRYTDVRSKYFDVPKFGTVVENTPVYTKDGELIILAFNHSMPIGFQCNGGECPYDKPHTYYKGDRIYNSYFYCNDDFDGIDLNMWNDDKVELI